MMWVCNSGRFGKQDCALPCSEMDQAHYALKAELYINKLAAANYITKGDSPPCLDTVNFIYSSAAQSIRDSQSWALSPSWYEFAIHYMNAEERSFSFCKHMTQWGLMGAMTVVSGVSVCFDLSKMQGILKAIITVCCAISTHE